MKFTCLFDINSDMATKNETDKNLGHLEAECVTNYADGNKVTQKITDNVDFIFSPPIEVASYSDDTSKDILKITNEQFAVVKKQKDKNPAKRWGRKMNKRERIAIKRAIKDLQRFRESEMDSTIRLTDDKKVEYTTNENDSKNSKQFKKADADTGK